MQKVKPVQVLGIYDLIKHKTINAAMQKVFLSIHTFLLEHSKKQRQRIDAQETRIGILEGHIHAIQKARLERDDE